MHIKYNRLWILLSQKGLKKTDLISLCGISSRTLTKLSKDQNVNTDTLVRICEVLGCGLSDIAELTDGEEISLYGEFKRSGKLLCADDYCNTYSFEYKGRRVILKKTKKKANKYTVINCSGRSITWEQTVQISVYTSENEYFEVDMSEKRDPDTVYIFVASGVPNHFKGLDEGLFLSAQSNRPQDSGVYVMSERRFKNFDI